MCVLSKSKDWGGYDCETVATGLLSGLGSWQEEPVIGSIHPSQGMNEKLFINTLYRECLNEKIIHEFVI